MSILQIQPKSKPSNVIPFAPLSQARLRRRIHGLIKSYVRGYISLRALNEYAALEIPAGTWIDCGNYRVCLDYTRNRKESLPVLTIQAVTESQTGHCPVCGLKQMRYLSGSKTKGFDFFCMSCGAIYAVKGDAVKWIT